MISKNLVFSIDDNNLENFQNAQIRPVLPMVIKG